MWKKNRTLGQPLCQAMVTMSFFQPLTFCGNFSFWRPRKPIAFARSTYDKQNYPNF